MSEVVENPSPYADHAFADDVENARPSEEKYDTDVVEKKLLIPFQ